MHLFGSLQSLFLNFFSFTNQIAAEKRELYILKLQDDFLVLRFLRYARPRRKRFEETRLTNERMIAWIRQWSCHTLCRESCFVWGRNKKGFPISSKKRRHVCLAREQQQTHGARLALFSVPTSKVIGRHWDGCTPASAVYRDSFPTGMPIPNTPRSPRPRMRSPSVTQIAWISKQSFKEGKWRTRAIYEDEKDETDADFDVQL